MYYVRTAKGLMIAKVSASCASAWMNKLKGEFRSKNFKSGTKICFVFTFEEDTWVGNDHMQILLDTGGYLDPA
jgi:hypothetical protein